MVTVTTEPTKIRITDTKVFIERDASNTQESGGAHPVVATGGRPPAQATTVVVGDKTGKDLPGPGVVRGGKILTQKAVAVAHTRAHIDFIPTDCRVYVNHAV